MRFQLPVFLFSLLAVMAAPAAMAGDGLPGQTARQTQKACAAFGPGFVSVNGSESCVKVSGRIRLEYGSLSGGGHGSGGAERAAVAPKTTSNPSPFSLEPVPDWAFKPSAPSKPAAHIHVRAIPASETAPSLR